MQNHGRDVGYVNEGLVLGKAGQDEWSGGVRVREEKLYWY